MIEIQCGVDCLFNQAIALRDSTQLRNATVLHVAIGAAFFVSLLNGRVFNIC